MTTLIGLAGASEARRTTNAEFKIGTPALDTDNRTWVYVKASGAVATGTCTVSGAFVVTDAAGTYTADTAFADGEYGWVRKTPSPL